jgi:hypothetical protein
MLGATIQNLFAYTNWHTGVNQLIHFSINRKDNSSHYEDFSTLETFQECNDNN